MSTPIKSIISIVLISTFVLFTRTASAGFPDDFSDVTWLDPDISSWPVTASISVNVSGSTLSVNDTKRNVWPRRFHSVLQSDCCNRSLWLFIKYKGRWYASTFEYMRFGQIDKAAKAVSGKQIKRPPFLEGKFNWQPAEGEVYGFMTSGMARFNLIDNNVRERSNVALYRWGVGPTNNANFEEVPRNSTGGTGSEPTPEPPEEEEEICVPPPPPVPEVNTHTYSGNANGNLEITGATNDQATFNDTVAISVKDDRSLTFTVGDESFSTTVAQNDTFTGKFTFDIGGLGVCIVDINVNGVINGKSASGSASGQDACGGNTANFSANFSASSPTSPSYLDQRPPIQAPRNPCEPANLSPIYQLLLD